MSSAFLIPHLSNSISLFYLSIMPSESIHVLNGKISFFLMNYMRDSHTHTQTHVYMYNTFIHLSAAILRWLLYFCYYTFTAVIMDPWIYWSSFWCGPSALLNLLIRKTNSYSTLYSKFLAVSDTWERLGKYLEVFLYICTNREQIFRKKNNMFPTKGNTYSFLKSGSAGIWRGTWNKPKKSKINFMFC